MRCWACLDVCASVLRNYFMLSWFPAVFVWFLAIVLEVLPVDNDNRW